MMQLKDKSFAAALPLLVLFVGWIVSGTILSLLGYPVAGIIGGLFIGLGFMDLLHSFPLILERVLPLLRPRGVTQSEAARIGAMIRAEQERSSENAKIDETPKRVELDSEYKPTPYVALKPSGNHKKWDQSENGIILE